MQTGRADVGLRFRKTYSLAGGQGHCFKSVPPSILWLGICTQALTDGKIIKQLQDRPNSSSLPSSLQQPSADGRVHEVNGVAEGLPELFFRQQGRCLHREYGSYAADAFLANE